jgi:hypothetical protein
MIRFSKKNGIDFLAFWNMMKKTKKKYAQMSFAYLLNYTPLNVLDYSKFAFATGIKEEEVFRMTLYHVLKKFSINDNLDRSRFLFGMLRNEIFYYCPECLKEKPYHRLIWEIEDIIACPEHKVFLQKTCPHCATTLKQHDLKDISICPHCAGNLATSKGISIINDTEYNKQLWLYESWNELFQSSEEKYEAQSLALKALYLLNKKNLLFDREILCQNIKNTKLLPTLLQHARNTLVQDRTIHLKFILAIAFQENIKLQDFFNINLPQGFLNSVLLKPDLKKESPSCRAPWCKNYNIHDSLLKIATSYQRKYDSDFKSFYFICPKCGCEFIFDKRGNINERTTFIKAYNILKNLKLKNMELKDVCELTNIKKERMRRYIAYFSSNGILEPIMIYSKELVDKTMLDRFVNDFKQSNNIENVKGKDYWKNNYHYLLHRYNNLVLQVVAEEHLKRHIKTNVEEKQNLVSKVLKDMYENSLKITIDSVCKNMNIDHETIRSWQCNKIIRDMKVLQKEKIEMPL